jgi:hypothetical protein
MERMTAFAGEDTRERKDEVWKGQLHESILRLFEWLEKNDYRGYDTFDGLSAFLRPLTFENKFLRIGPASSAQPTPLARDQEKPLHQGNGISGTRLPQTSSGYR